jgi:hypothetical protein
MFVISVRAMEWGAIPRESVTVKPERDKSDTWRTSFLPPEPGMDHAMADDPHSCYGGAVLFYGERGEK